MTVTLVSQILYDKAICSGVRFDKIVMAWLFINKSSVINDITNSSRYVLWILPWFW